MQNPLQPTLPGQGERAAWTNLVGAASALAIVNAAKMHNGLCLLVCTDSLSAHQYQEAIQYFTNDCKVQIFPDWETLPYDQFSPHQDIISDRLRACHDIPLMQSGIVIVPVTTLMQRIAPKGFVEQKTLLFKKGSRIDGEALREKLVRNNYYAVSKVMEHGEFCYRGSIIDIFPMGANSPIRIDLFDDEIESLRHFNVDNQCSTETVSSIEILPAREFPLDPEAITRFRRAWREKFTGNPIQCPTYEDVTNGIASAGIEYYLPLFFDELDSLFSYLPDNTVCFYQQSCHDRALQYFQEVQQRYEQLRYDVSRPLLAPDELYLSVDEVFANFKRFAQITLESEYKNAISYASAPLPGLQIQHKLKQPMSQLASFIDTFRGRILLCAESAGRREVLMELLHDENIRPITVESWDDFLNNEASCALTIAQLPSGCILTDDEIAIITEAELYGQHIISERKRNSKQINPDLVIRNLAELRIGDAVVHIDHGIGRYQGLQKLTTGGVTSEFLTLLYDGDDKIYVPITSLDRISRYTGIEAENVKLNKLGSSNWSREKQKAIEKIHDVAAQLLDVYAKREAHKGFTFALNRKDYTSFCMDFPFEETADQMRAIDDVLNDMTSDRAMDRLVCGDVGFGKTEVAMRAAFLAVNNNKQVAVLVPTTLLANQHFENFKDRFASLPVNIHLLSRFRTASEQTATLNAVEAGKVDIVVGTHKLLQKNLQFKDLGLLIIDEEHRFGVNQKEALKKYRHSIDILTLTATPIPRTLNMSMAGMRDISIIATPPAKRLSIKTFAAKSNKQTTREAILREIMRGGQVFFLHNKVDTIDRVARDIAELVPEAKVTIAHGQMRERELESVMSDFYHHRFNVLVCTTIIETGIDIPTANTIIINRADHFGLAQLHQLRGRVGRSHHQAYAYLIIPDKKAMTRDAIKRIEAFLSLDDLGAGFMLATHDMEIRGAGELLGAEQSGQMQTIGFSLYMELLDRAVSSLKSGDEIALENPFDDDTHINARIPAIIPDDYVPDVQLRLTLYKRISNTKNDDQLKALQVEMIDRFGLLPDSVKNLIQITRYKHQAKKLGIKKLDLGDSSGFIEFTEKPAIDPKVIIRLIQTQSAKYKLSGPEKLQYCADMATNTDKLNAISDILKTLGDSKA